MKLDSSKLLLATMFVAMFVGFGNSDLVMIPRDTVAVVGQTAYFNCSTTAIQNPEIHWHYGNEHIYAGGKLLSPYERFRIEIDNSTTSYNLVIPNVRRDDAGRYRCLDNQGFGEKRWAELVVLDGNLVCESDKKEGRVVGPNDCNIDSEAVHLSCSATYNGNTPPILKWTRLGDSSPISMDRTTCRNSTNRVDCNLTITADHLRLNGLSYVCYTEQTTNINCTSDSIYMIYSFDDFRVTERLINDELSCKVNSSEQCINRWIWKAVDGSKMALYDQSNVTAELSGLYRCESECNIRGKRCTVSAMLVYIPSAENKTSFIGPSMVHTLSEILSTTASDCTSSTAYLALLIVPFVTYVASLMVCCFKWRKLKRKQSKKETEELPYDRVSDALNSDSEEPLRPTIQLKDVRASSSNEGSENQRLVNNMETGKKETEELPNDRDSDALNSGKKETEELPNDRDSDALNSDTLTNDEIRDRVVRIYAHFVSDVDPDRLSDFLKQENILGIGEYQEISARNPSSYSRCRSLLDHLLRKANPRTFLIVRQALKYDDHYLLDRIDGMDMSDHLPSNSDHGNLSQEAFEAGRRLCENENQQLVKRNGQLEQKLLQMERQALADKEKILQLVEKLETLKMKWLAERDLLVKTQRELEHRHNSEDIDYNMNATLIRTIRTKAADNENKGIAGLTVLAGELFVVSRMSLEIEVYDSTSFNLRRRMPLPDLKNPEDIVSSARNNSLYISDWKYFDQAKEIMQITPDGKLVKKWSTDDNGGSLSISEDSNVTLTIRNYNRLHEYTSDGLFLREFNLTPGIVHPSHALKLTNGQFVVSYGDVGDREHGVCLLDDSGRIVRSVGGRDSVFDGMDVPFYISADNKGSILVLDRNNKRVLVFSLGLGFRGELLSRDEGLQDSHRMFIDSSTGRLFVADNMVGWIHGRVLIFDIRL